MCLNVLEGIEQYGFTLQEHASYWSVLRPEESELGLGTSSPLTMSTRYVTLTRSIPGRPHGYMLERQVERERERERSGTTRCSQALKCVHVCVFMSMCVRV